MYVINTITQFDVWQLVKFQLALVLEMKWFLSYLWIIANINSEIR